jgi:hypothetical protein
VPARDRQDALLRQIVTADDLASGEFTATRFQGGATILFHPGLANGQVLLYDNAAGDIRAMGRDGLLSVMALSHDGSVKFVATDATRSYIERLDAGGPTQLEAATSRADNAEAALVGLTRAAEEHEAAVRNRRRRIADKIAWLPTAIVVGAVALLIFLLSQSGPLAAVWGFLGAVGVAAGQLFTPVRSRIAAGLVKVLQFIHDRT